MARILIKDLPVEMKISKEEMKKTFGGLTKKRVKRIRFASARRRDWLGRSLLRRDDPDS